MAPATTIAGTFSRTVTTTFVLKATLTHNGKLVETFSVSRRHRASFENLTRSNNDAVSWLGRQLVKKMVTSKRVMAIAGQLERSTSNAVASAASSGPTGLISATPQGAAYAFIVGIEKYRDLPSPDGARADAEAFAQIMKTTLGLPNERVRVALDDRATAADIRRGVKWLTDNVPAGGRAYFFFSGHGAPDPSSGTSYLVPYDGDPSSLVESAIGLKTLIDTLVKLGIWLAGLFIAAIVVMPGLTAASLLAGLGIGAVAIGFAFQDIFENFLAGVLIMLREKMRIGDVIECEGITGKVEHITLRETHVRKLSGELTVVPNSILFKNPVEILTDDSQRRHEVVVGVSYDTQLDRAAEVIRQAVEDVEDVLASKGIDIFAQEFNSSSVDFLVRWWAGSTPRDGWESKDKVVRAVKAALDEAGIEIPFPYVTHTFKETVPVSHLGDTSRSTP